MANPCPECGALLAEGDSCQGIFDAFLAREFTDPGYGEVHMLTVACFMIQHGRYSDEALAWIEQKLRAVLEEGLSPEELLRQAARETGQRTRTWKVNRGPEERSLPRVAWSMTIADVARNERDARSYCALVRQWAEVTLREMGRCCPDLEGPGSEEPDAP